jgi:hypothetical protein
MHHHIYYIKRKLTANAVVIGTTGDGSSENGKRVGKRIRKGKNWHANANGRRSSTVQS